MEYIYNKELYKQMLDSTDEGIYFVDRERKITFWNKGAERITGYSAEEVINTHCYDNLLNHIDDNGTQLCHTGCPVNKTIEDGNNREANVYLHHKLGHRVPIRVRAIPIIINGHIQGAVELFNDNKLLFSLNKDLDKYKVLAIKDQLSGLYNRRYLESYIDSRIAEYNLYQIQFGIAMIDIDNFKAFNDTYGHSVGDDVIVMVSNTMKNSLRDSDVVGRWGGEEFLIVFYGINEENLFVTAEKIRSLIENSFIKYKDKVLKVTVSIGTTMYKSKETMSEAINRADKMLYNSKSKGRNRTSIE